MQNNFLILACKILRFSDVGGLAKTTSMHENLEKSVALICENCLKRLLFGSKGLSHYYQIPHSQDHVCGDKKIKQVHVRNALRKLLGPETVNNVAILSQKRQEQVSYFNVCLLGKLNNSLCM